MSEKEIVRICDIQGTPQEIAKKHYSLMVELFRDHPEIDIKNLMRQGSEDFRRLISELSRIFPEMDMEDCIERMEQFERALESEIH